MELHRLTEAPSIAITAALRLELAGFHRSIPRGAVLVQTGVGKERAGRKLRELLASGEIRQVISTGMAGALSPCMKVGDLVIAKHIHGDVDDLCDGELLQITTTLAGARTDVHISTCVPVDEIVWRSDEKAALAHSVGGDSLFVDMESEGIAPTCREYGVPFVIVRAISDAAGESLPFDLNRCRNRGGGISPVRVASHAMFRPSSFRRLNDLRARCVDGSRKLAEFVREVVPLCQERGAL